MTKIKHRILVKDLVSGNKETSATAFIICIIFIRFFTFVGAAKGPPLLSSD